MKIRFNPRDFGFPKERKRYISNIKLTSLAGSGVKISYNLRGGILTQGPKIVIFSGSWSTFLSNPFRPGDKIRMAGFL